MRVSEFTPAEQRSFRYRYQAKAADIMPNERVARCMRRPIAGAVSLCHNGKSGYFAGLQTCGSVWMCPVCAAKITERRRLDVDQATKNHLSNGGSILLVTYTMRHHAGQDLPQLLKQLTTAQRKMRGGSVYKQWREKTGLLGTIRALEVTHGENGWHPHVHELYFFKSDKNVRQVSEIKDFLYGAWSHQLDCVGADVNYRGVDVRKVYDGGALSKYLNKAGWTAAAELTKIRMKTGSKGGRSPQSLLQDALAGDALAALLYRDYCKAFKSKKMLFWSRGLRVLLLGEVPEKSDEELAAEEQDGNVLIILDSVQWRRLLLADLRGELLGVLDGANPDEVRDWLLVRGIIDD